MYHIILILLVVKTEAAIQLGQIQQANWALNLSQIDNEYINISNITCHQCLCRMLEMNNLTTSIACQQTRKTCQLLFWNATAKLQTDETSVVYFQTIPTFLQMIVNQQPMTSTSSSKFTTAVTTKAITSFAAITSMNNPSTTITTVLKMATTAVIRIFLINPGGELGSLYPWTSSSSSAPVLDDGTASSGSPHPYNGSYDFYGSTGGGSLHQKVSLTSTFSTTQLDSGLLSASISFWEKSADATTPDTAQVTLVFLSTTNSSLSNVTTGPKACISAWCHVTGSWSLPVGTRTIDYVMTFVAKTGNHADAWIDDNSLNIA